MDEIPLTGEAEKAARSKIRSSINSTWPGIAFVILVDVAATYYVARITIPTEKLQTRGVSATAKVDRLYETPSMGRDPGNVCNVNYEFPIPNNLVVHARDYVTCDQYQRLYIGAPISILYDPQNPLTSGVDDYRVRDFSMWLLWFGIAVINALVLLWCALGAWKLLLLRQRADTEPIVP